MIIKDKRSKPKRNQIMGVDIPIGMVFYGKTSEKVSLHLRCYLGIIDLEDPKRTWGFTDGSWSPTIYDYQPVRATIIVEEDPVE